MYLGWLGSRRGCLDSFLSISLLCLPERCILTAYENILAAALHLCITEVTVNRLAMSQYFFNKELNYI